MRKVKNENVIEITEDVKVGNGFILESGDKIRVLKEEVHCFDGHYFVGCLDLEQKRLVISTYDGDYKDLRLLSKHQNDPFLEDIYEALEKKGYPDVEVDESKKGIVEGNNVRLFLK